MACEQDSEDRQHVHENSGAVCLSAGEDGGIAVEVVFDVCLSGSCDALDSHACHAALDGDRLSISSRLTYTTRVGPSGECTLDCQIVKGTCGDVRPATSSIRVVHGSNESDVIALPLAGDTELFSPDSSPSCY